MSTKRREIVVKNTPTTKPVTEQELNELKNRLDRIYEEAHELKISSSEHFREVELAREQLKGVIARLFPKKK